MNSTMIKGEAVKVIMFGVWETEPKEGERFIYMIDGKAYKSYPVEKIVVYDYSVTLWIVETKNAIYILTKRGE